MRSLGDVTSRPPIFGTEGIARLFSLGMLARTPEAALGLLFILRTREMGGSFALAGLVSAGIGVNLALGGPVLGRLIDRRGQSRVLIATSIISGIVLLLAAALPHGTPPVLLAPLACVLGFWAPPIAPCLRALFVRLLDREVRDRALALDAALQEVSFTAGPLIFVTAIGSFSVRAALAASGLCLCGATYAFASSPQSRGVGPDVRTRPRWGALASIGIRTLVGVATGIGGMYGATEVGLTARAALHGGPVLLGVLIVVWSLPSLLAGLVVARWPVLAVTPRALGLLTVGAALLTGGLGACGGVDATGVVLAASGALAAPLFSVMYSLVANNAPEGCLTEANTWVSSGLFAGLALGSAVGGALISLIGPGAAFVAGGALAAIAALAVLLVRRRIVAGGEVAPAGV